MAKTLENEKALTGLQIEKEAYFREIILVTNNKTANSPSIPKRTEIVASSKIFETALEQ